MKTGSMMKRTTDWRARLMTYLARAHSAQFRPGQHDCALFASGAVAAMTGVDLATHWRGRYRTIRGGLRVLRAEGYANHIALADALFDSCPVAMAQVGDLAAVPGPDGLALGVVQGARIYVLRPDGLATVDLLAAVRAWRVPA
jgi:hypothetical protein